MAINEKSWEDIEILIFGRVPGQPMDLEQNIAMNIPGIETHLESFENYQDALDYSKNSKRVGFVLIIEDDLDPSIGEIFKNLANPFSSNGWEAFGALIHKESETIHGHRTVAKDKRLLDYLPWESFSDESESRIVIQDLWKSFTRAFEEQLIPVALQESIISLGLQCESSSALSFYDRINNLLTANLSLSWKERFALKWYYAVQLANEREPAALAPHKALQNIVNSISINLPQNGLELDFLRNQDAALSSRALHILTSLTKSKIDGTLVESTEAFSAFERPGSPALLRTVAKNKSIILGFSENKKAVG